MLNCQHHIQWVTEVPGGLHQCIQCTRVVTKKDVQPRMEDLPPEFERRWDAWEATRPQEQQAAPVASPAPPPPVTPARPPLRAERETHADRGPGRGAPRGPAPAPPAQPNHPA